MSYRDHVDFGLVGDRDQVADAWPLMEGLETSLDELCEVICRKKPERRAPGRDGQRAKGKREPAAGSGKPEPAGAR